MQTYVINLDSATDRWQRFCRLMDKTGIEYQRVSAVLGRELSLPIKEFSQTRYRWFHGKRPNLGQIGCFLSHIHALNLLLQSDEQFAMICEDDITPDENLKAIVDSAMQYSSHWDILRLCGFHDAHPTKLCSLDDGYSLAVNRTRLCGTGCYIVSRDAAETLVQAMLPMQVPIDHAIDREWFYGLRAMAVDPLPVLQNPDDVPSSLPAARNEKYPSWQRYWGVFPYRAYNETCRYFARGKLLRQSRELFKAGCNR